MALTLSGDTGVGYPLGGTQSLGATPMTAQASTSGTSIDFTSIPTGVKRITIMFSGVSTSGTSPIQAQIGAGSIVNTGYVSNGGAFSGSNTTNATSSTTGVLAEGGANLGTDTRNGTLTFVNITGNTWIASGVMSHSSANMAISTGSITLSGALDRVRITTVNGTDTFDAGTINVLYE